MHRGIRCYLLCIEESDADTGMLLCPVIMHSLYVMSSLFTLHAVSFYSADFRLELINIIISKGNIALRL
jgi:hypothetical protein